MKTFQSHTVSIYEYRSMCVSYANITETNSVLFFCIEKNKKWKEIGTCALWLRICLIYVVWIFFSANKIRTDNNDSVNWKKFARIQSIDCMLLIDKIGRHREKKKTYACCCSCCYHINTPICWTGVQLAQQCPDMNDVALEVAAQMINRFLRDRTFSTFKQSIEFIWYQKLPIHRYKNRTLIQIQSNSYIPISIIQIKNELCPI